MFASLRARLPRIGRWPRLLLAGTCALLALASLAGGRPGPTADGVAVVVASHDMPAGHRLQRADIALLRLPRAAQPVGARADPGAFVGARLAGPIRSREPITPTRLVSAGLAAGLPAGEVAAPVQLAGSHVTDLVRRGDHVDLLETERPPDVLDGSAPPATRVDTVGRHLLVLAVLPPGDDGNAELIVATDRVGTVRITRDSSNHIFTAVVDPP
jgi:Flp pilus assembly protein CpaB